MCGGSDRATREAAAAEEDRKRQVRAATAAIESAFGSPSRGRQIDEFMAAIRDRFTDEARRRKEDVGRAGKFALARSGLTGGSTAADFGVQLGEEFQEGLLTGERKAQSARADLEAADAASRQNLIALAQGGADVGTAARQAAAALQSNLSGVRARSMTEGLGDIFATSKELTEAREAAAGRRRGLSESEIYANPFSRGST